MTAVLIAGIAVSLLVLASTIADVAWLRGVLVAGLLLTLVPLLVRIGSDIRRRSLGLTPVVEGCRVKPRCWCDGTTCSIDIPM